MFKPDCPTPATTGRCLCVGLLILQCKDLSRTYDSSPGILAVDTRDSTAIRHSKRGNEASPAGIISIPCRHSIDPPFRDAGAYHHNPLVKVYRLTEGDAAFTRCA